MKSRFVGGHIPFFSSNLEEIKQYYELLFRSTIKQVRPAFDVLKFENLALASESQFYALKTNQLFVGSAVVDFLAFKQSDVLAVGDVSGQLNFLIEPISPLTFRVNKFGFSVNSQARYSDTSFYNVVCNTIKVEISTSGLDDIFYSTDIMLHGVLLVFENENIFSPPLNPDSVPGPYMI
jgi:hypothetical protein